MSDLYIATVHQTLCPRIVNYFDQRSLLSLFPEENFGTKVCIAQQPPNCFEVGLCLFVLFEVRGVSQAEELGPHTNSDGPQLVRKEAKELFSHLEPHSAASQCKLARTCRRQAKTWCLSRP